MTMRALIAGLILFTAGCSDLRQADKANAEHAKDPGHANSGYVLRTQRPEAILDEIWARYPHEFDKFLAEWTDEASAQSLDGQRTVELLELACYADVTCHVTESPLRVATLDFIRANLGSADVRTALKWIARSYQTDMPLDRAGSKDSELFLMVEEAMNKRMVEYAEELLGAETRPHRIGGQIR